MSAHLFALLEGLLAGDDGAREQAIAALDERSTSPLFRLIELPKVALQFRVNHTPQSWGQERVIRGRHVDTPLTKKADRYQRAIGMAAHRAAKGMQISSLVYIDVVFVFPRLKKHKKISKLENWQIEQGLNDSKLADLLSIDHSYIFRLKNGERRASPDLALLIEQISGGRLVELRYYIPNACKILL